MREDDHLSTSTAASGETRFISEDGRESVCVRTKVCVYKCICVHVLSETSTNKKMRPCASRHTLTCHKHAHALLMTGNRLGG